MKKSISRTRAALAIGVASTVVFALGACSADPGTNGDPDDSFPDRPITIVVGHNAGGGNDLIMRMMAPAMSDELGVPVQVENHVGGSGTVAVMNVHAQPADGYTIAQLSPQVLYINELLGEVPISADEFTTIGITNVDPGMIAVPEDSPFETINDLVAAARERELTASISGLTGPDGIGLFLLMEAFDIDITPIVYDSGAEKDTAVQGGHVDLSVRNGGWYAQEGLRLLAIAHPERIEELPDTPTILEDSGVELVFGTTRGMAVRSDTPPEIIEILERAFEVAAHDPSVREEMLPRIGFRWEYMDRDAIAQEYEENQIPDADLVFGSERLRAYID